MQGLEEFTFPEEADVPGGKEGGKKWRGRLEGRGQLSGRHWSRDLRAASDAGLWGLA